MIWNPLLWPRWLKLAGIGALLVIAAVIYVNARERAAVKADRAKAAVEALERQNRADRAAQSTVDASRKETEDGNTEARKAAADNPDDPLKGALDKLREKR